MVLDLSLELDLHWVVGFRRALCLGLRLELDLYRVVGFRKAVCLDLSLEVDLNWMVGLRRAACLGRRFTVLLLLQKDLVVQELELCWVQFWFGKERWWLFVDNT